MAAKQLANLAIRPPAARRQAPFIYSIEPCSKAEKIFGSKSFSQSANKPFLIKERFSGILAKGKKQCKQCKQRIVYARMIYKRLIFNELGPYVNKETKKTSVRIKYDLIVFYRAIILHVRNYQT